MIQEIQSAAAVDSSDKGRERSYELDLLRFAAAVAVMIYHYVAWYTYDCPQQSVVLDRAANVTQFGWLGVPLFFMISGYVILTSALNRSAIQFAISRFIRLYPLYWICMAVTVFVLLATGNAHSEPIRHSTLDWKTLIVNLTMFQYILGFEDIDGVYWTLIKELQFYVLMGVLIYFNVVKYVRVWLSTWLVLTFTFFAFGQPSFLGVIISPEYSPFFMGGITFSLIRNRGLNFFNGLIAVLTAGFACWVTIGNSGPFLHVSISHQVLICQAIVLAFFVVFFMIATRRIRMKAVPTIATLGMITYPLYLLHNYVGKSLMNAALPYFRPEFLVVTMCLIAIVVSCVVYKYLDRPVTKLMKRWLIGPPREHCGVEPRIPEAKS